MSWQPIQLHWKGRKGAGTPLSRIGQHRCRERQRLCKPMDRDRLPHWREALVDLNLTTKRTIVVPALLSPRIMRRLIPILLGSLVLSLSILVAPAASWAYPFWAQQNYDNPREATGKIVCANCHLAQKTTQAEVPQSVLPDSVFKAVVKIPYKKDATEISSDGSDVPLQVGAVVMLPDGFKLAPQDRWSEEIKEETKGVFFPQYLSLIHI